MAREEADHKEKAEGNSGVGGKNPEFQIGVYSMQQSWESHLASLGLSYLICLMLSVCTQIRLDEISKFIHTECQAKSTFY